MDIPDTSASPTQEMASQDAPHGGIKEEEQTPATIIKPEPSHQDNEIEKPEQGSETPVAEPPQENKEAKEAKEAKETKRTAKGGRGSKKASEKTKQPPSKKRKVSEPESTNAVADETVKKEDKETTNEDTKPAKAKGGKRKGGQSEEWNEESDRVLTELVKKHTNGDMEANVPWAKTYADFQATFPGTQRSLNSVKMRWFNVLKHGNVELDADQIKAFRQAVSDINGSEKNAAIAWRYQQITSTPMNKGAVAKLLKSLSISS
ncbi:hypothetical protein ABW19_dt0202529 [Dactylella cylindrospora]|nr:hypothetical protein ABW19_dt0202529 [Dactylella cylindrospora]